jgi:hypothetical protein
LRDFGKPPVSFAHHLDHFDAAEDDFGGCEGFEPNHRPNAWWPPGRSGRGVAKYRRLPHPNSVITITKQAKNDMMNRILNALWFEARST